MAESPEAADAEKKSLNQRVSEYLLAVRQTPRVLRLVWEAYPGAALAVPFLMLIVGPMPALWLYCVKKVVDGVGLWLQGDVSAGRHTVPSF